ncbi:Restriction endonuclease S subunit (HsdS) [Fructobacillus fructosus]|uniref:restriction endonuclease subunit S n=1 Tax=Fructobacillus fructosus TaxID=1631 RepID=UPI002DAA9503|nr:Restriction endonuclease S subunit (HsdS) [Fructobacillus fructosus]CAK1244739.1 Restriction endonuclease S subunit (HsdS) [Fructobacillus fructosus]
MTDLKKDKKMIPNIRFKGFTDDWEQRKLKTIAVFNPKSNLPDQFEYVDLESVRGVNLTAHRTESLGKAPSRAQRLAQKNDIFYQTVRPYQKNNYLYELDDTDYVFSTGYAQLRPQVNSYFLFSILQRETFVQDVLNQCTGTGYPAISSKDLSEIEVDVPNDDQEQLEVGLILRRLDKTLTLHQCKLENLEKLKKLLLQKLFPKNGQCKPDIRFAGFTDDWEQRKFEELVSFIDGDRGKNYPGENDFLSNGNVLFLDTKNVRPTGFDFFHKKFISDKKDSLLRNGTLLVNDFVLTSRGTLGNVAFYSNNINTMFPKIRINSAMLIVRNRDTDYLSNTFLYTLLRGNLISKFLKVYHVGSAQPHITKKDLSKLNIELPSSLNEQNDVGILLQNLDKILTLHQRKLDELGLLKNFLLQNMFV